MGPDHERQTKSKPGTGEDAPNPVLASSVKAAWKHHQAGRYNDARALYEHVIEQAPRHGQCLNLLGILHYQNGRPDLALEFMSRAVAENDLAHILHGFLGEIYRVLGRYDEAITSCRRAIELKAVHPDALNTLGASLNAQGKTGEAIAILEETVEYKPDLVEAHANLGIAYRASGNYDKASAALQRALELSPKFFGALAVLGGVRHDQGRVYEAADCYRRVLEARPDDAPTMSSFAITLRSLGKTDEAVDCLRRAVRLRPGFAEGHANLGTMLLNAKQDLDGAIASFQEALRLVPKFAEALQGMAGALAVSGEFDQAAEYSRRALKVNPEYMDANLAMVRAGGLAGGENDVARLEERLDKGGLSKVDECDLRFALGTAHDRAGRYDAAFGQFRDGNDLTGKSGVFDLVRFTASIDRQIERCTADFFDQRQSWGRDSERPVFIVGMLRSGTTLVEQIVSSHPEIFGAGELEEFLALALELPAALKTDASAADCAALVDQGTVQRLADRYLAHLDTLDSDALRVTDKMLGNFQHLDLFALLFPGARVIHCRRDPLDVCLSCYFHDFSRGHSYTYDLAELGAYYRQYERLMDHWRAVLPIALLEVDYEDLIDDQEAVSRRMIEFCGVPWDNACLGFHENERPVFTDSMWQVRQPIYATSVGRWRNYESHLDPLKSALGITDVKAGT